MWITTGINRFTESQNIASLVYFRIAFGITMVISTLRFMLKGWVDTLLVQPNFRFSYFGFEWAQVDMSPTLAWCLILFQLIGAIGILLGFKFRYSAALFALSFLCIELQDASLYLNHYYFVSWVALLLPFTPAAKAFSLDYRVAPRNIQIPGLWINGFRLFLLLVYFFAGVAKLNPDWLFKAQPLSIWLPALQEFPLIGSLLAEPAAAYVASWFGCVFDLSIGALLWMPTTRKWAYFFVVVFHVFTGLFFQIGVFPLVMICLTPVFFSSAFHLKWLEKFNLKIGPDQSIFLPIARFVYAISLLLLCFHLLFPFRYALYPGKLFWTEQGYRFSWRVMLMEKNGYGSFWLDDTNTGAKWNVDPSEYLLPHQEKQLYTQPDFILQFAHFLGEQFPDRNQLKVSADIYVTLNGSLSQPFINPSVNLQAQKDGWGNKNWINPWNE